MGAWHYRFRGPLKNELHAYSLSGRPVVLGHREGGAAKMLARSIRSIYSMSAVACKVREPANRSGMSCEVYEITIGALCSKVCRFTQCTRSVALGSLRVIGDTTMSMSKSFLAAIAAIAAVTVAQPSVAKDTVRIAFIGPLTGGNSAAGLGGRNSAQLAVSLRNANPSAQFNYELVTLDDECKPNVGIQVATKVASDDSIIAAIPHYCSAVGIATVDVYARFGLPVVIWGAILPAITYGNDYHEIHRVSGTMINEADLAAQFLTKQGYKKVVVVHDTTDFGKGQNKYFSEALAKTDGKIIATFPVNPDQQDLTAELTKIKDLKPDIVFLGGLTPLGVRLRAQMERVGLNVQFAAVSGIMTTGFIEGAGGAAEGTISFHNGMPIEKYPEGLQFLADYAKAGFREDPDAYGPFAFAATNLVMDAIEKVGPSRDKVKEFLDGTKGYKSLIGEINFDDHRQNLVSANPYIVQDGKWVYWPDSAYATGKRKLIAAP